MIIQHFKPSEKAFAFVFSIDDLHPAKLEEHGYDAGGDLENGALKHVLKLISNHPELKVTLFTTADWREKSPVPTYTLLKKIPWLRDQIYLTSIRPKDYFNLSKYPEFVSFFNNKTNLEIAYHGLHHIHKGIKIPVEFQNESKEFISNKLKEMITIFDKSQIQYVKGFTPPAWNATPQLIEALIENGIQFLGSARDINTPITIDAKNSMSGIKDASIIFPEWLHDKKIIHIPTNFQVTSTLERAMEIAALGGLISVKGHIIKNMYGFESVDAITEDYMNFIDEVLSKLKEKYGSKCHFTSMGQMTQYILNNDC